ILLPEGHNALRQTKKIRCEKIKILGLRPYPPLGSSKIKVKVKVKVKIKVKVKVKVKRKTLEAPPPNLRRGG
ncbi:MAG: hypothetical protein HW380_2931, partial [Magnetococcales bacterium]|nr:hypothetical protein [Magnetococcales bacterium]